MAVSKAEIKNFTVFKDLSIEFCRGVNVLIGENGTGKTHLLKLLYSFLSYHKSPDALHNDDFIKILSNVFRASRLGLFTKPQEKMRLELNTFNRNEPYKFEIWQVEGDYPPAVLGDLKNDIDSSVFLPAKDMLTHSKGFMSLYNATKISFDKSYYDIISEALLPELRLIPEIAINLIPRIENIIDGKIVVENDTFYLEKRSGRKIEFSVEAEGIKKIGLLWQLLMNESITKDTVLLWDEPEANINPKLIPDIVEILLELSRQGVQVFVATHNYIFAKYMQVLAKQTDEVLFHSLYKTENSMKCESGDKFTTLAHNDILLENIHLYEAEIRSVME